jgi:hypothetical protein
VRNRPNKSRDDPGGAHKRNFNKNPRGKHKISVGRGKKSRSKSRG